MKKKLHYFVISLLISILFLPFSIASAELSQARKLSASGLRFLPIGALDPEEKDLAQLTNEGSALSLRDFQKRVTEEVFQQAYLKASNTEADDQFGYSMAVSGNTLVIGAIGEDSDADVVNGDQGNNQAGFAGAAYVFVRSGDEWAFQAYLKASNSDPGDYFGYAVAISGDTIVVGAPYEDSMSTTINVFQDDVSLFEETGAAYVFVREGETWTQQAYLKPHNTDLHDYFGQAVDISGDTIVVGAMREDGTSEDREYDEGAAYVFVRDDSSWSQQAYLKASSAGEGDLFGYSVATSGDMIVVGAIYEDSIVLNSGAGYVFQRSDGEWSEETQLKASNADQGDFFGNSVDISDDTIVIGASCEASNTTGVNGNEENDEADHSGAAYVFTLDEDTWSQQAYLKASNTETEDRFGYAVAVSGNRILVGAFGEDSSASGFDGNSDDNSASEAGAAYLFTFNINSWSQIAYMKASNTDAGDRFGWSVDLSFDTVVVSAYQEDSNATGVDGDGGNNDAENSGAAYVFKIERKYALFLPLINK